LRGLAEAFRLLTRIPLGASEPGGLRGVVAWFPIVGAFVGLATGGVYALLYPWMPSTLAAVIVVGSGILLTGAFHEDGLADSFDAFGTGASGEAALEVMRDPRLGTYGTLAVVVSVVWRVAAVASLAPAAAIAGLVVAHILGRTGAATLIALAPAARDNGLGKLGVANVTGREAAIALVTGLGLGAAALGWLVGVAVIATTVTVMVLRSVSLKRLGGTTGDVLGACEQLVEMGCLAVVAAAAWLGWQPWWLG
jgi:adenosylcobinamide-GDP ribazoletransferase